MSNRHKSEKFDFVDKSIILLDIFDDILTIDHHDLKNIRQNWS